MARYRNDQDDERDYYQREDRMRRENFGAYDEPYRGGFSTSNYGRPKDRVHAIQIELARRLYMDEQALTKKPREFENLKSFCRTVAQALGELALV